MTMTKADAHWRVDHVISNDPHRVAPVAWFLRRWQAEQYIDTFANDYLNPKFSHVVVNEVVNEEDPPAPSDPTLTTYYIRLSHDGRFGGGYITLFDPPHFPHYVVKSPTKEAAIALVEGYRHGYHWASEQALRGNIHIDFCYDRITTTEV